MMFRRQRSIRAGRMEYAGVTPGTHEVRVRFGDTLPRQIGWGLSACAMLGWLGLVAWRQQAVPAAEDAAAQAPLWLAIALGGLVVVALGARAAADPYSWWRVKPAKMETPTAQYQLLAQLEGGIALVAYDLPRTSAKPGGSFPVMLYWEAVAPATRNLRSFVHLLGPDGKLWGSPTTFTQAGFKYWLPVGGRFIAL